MLFSTVFPILLRFRESTEFLRFGGSFVGNFCVISPPTFGWFFICRLFFTRFDFFSDFKCIQYQTITYVNTFLSNFVVVIKFQKHLALSRITLCFDSALSTISKVEHIFANLQTTFPTGYVIKYIKMCSKK